MKYEYSEKTSIDQRDCCRCVFSRVPSLCFCAGVLHRRSLRFANRDRAFLFQSRAIERRFAEKATALIEPQCARDSHYGGGAVESDAAFASLGYAGVSLF